VKVWAVSVSLAWPMVFVLIRPMGCARSVSLAWPMAFDLVCVNG
jgi:hypothetical protein